MDAEAAREVFTAAIQSDTNAESRAVKELLREFFTNQEFREGLAEYVYNLNNA